MAASIWWIRRDLRLTDNQALAAAVNVSAEIIPAFILDPTLLNSPNSSKNRIAFLFDGLRSLDADLRARGSRLIVRQGKPRDQLAQLMADSGATAIFAEEDYSPYARRRDAAVAQTLPLTLTAGQTVRHPTAIEKKAGGTYTVFTPFKRTWLSHTLPRRQDIIAAPERISTPTTIASLELPTEPTLPTSVPFVASEAAAQAQLKLFTTRSIFGYQQQRNAMALKGTSSLSPHLRFGMLSARQAVVTALDAISSTTDPDARKGAETWLSELIWREFYQMILHQFPHVAKGSFRPVYDGIKWRNDPDEFEHWCNGNTGYPVVDAAMRQLKQSGWMHNRARMIVASFLTKDLLINWQWGERWFMQNLVDGDLAANNGGWQWAAGTGTDAAPYFRIFNPISQGQKFDPDGTYVRRWVPELADVPTKHIHNPWELPPMLQKLHNCTIGVDYPAPLVDHKWAREATLAAYKAAKA